MDLLARVGDAAKRLWSSLDSARRIAVGIGAVLVLLLIGWGSRASSTAWQQVAGAEVDPAARADVAAQLKKSGQRHEVRDGGVWVPKADAERVVLELAGEGVLSDRAIWKWLETSDVMATGWDKSARMQVALQRKLESMIRKIDAVRNASVLITPESETQAWGFKGPTAKASVQVELKAGAKLSDANLKSIAGTVSGSVKGLDRDRVMISDTQGNHYRVARGDGSVMGASELADLELRTAKQIEEDILKLLPPGSRVSVRAIAKRTAERISEKKLDASPRVREEHERRSTPSGGQAPTRGIKGSGDLEGAAPAPAPAPPQEREFTVKQDFGHTQREQDNPAGAIERVTVGVLIPYPVDKDGKPLGQAPDEAKIRDLVMTTAAVQSRNDVSVMLVPTKAPEAVPAAAASDELSEWLAQNWTWIGLIALGLVALALAARLVRGAGREEVVEIPARPAAATAAAGGEGDALRDAVRDVVRRDPAEAAASLRSWMR